MGTTTATRQLYMSGNATKVASTQVRDALLKVAADEYEGLGVEELELRDNQLWTRDGPEHLMSLGDLAKKAAAQGVQREKLAMFRAPFDDPIDPETGQGNIWPDFTFGTTAVEVEIDEETGEIRVLKAVGCHDVGRAINPATVEGQIEGLTGENPFWGPFWVLEMLTDDERDLLLQARAQVHQDLIAYGKAPDRYSMIHADFVPENLLVDNGIVRVIDFDDAGFGWHLFKIATALYFLQGEPYFDSARDALIEGYRAHRPLSDEQLDHLPLFMTARGFTYLGWIHTRQETPTAQEMSPMLIKLVCDLSREYLSA